MWTGFKAAQGRPHPVHDATHKHPNPTRARRFPSAAAKQGIHGRQCSTSAVPRGSDGRVNTCTNTACYPQGNGAGPGGLCPRVVLFTAGRARFFLRLVENQGHGARWRRHRGRDSAGVRPAPTFVSLPSSALLGRSLVSLLPRPGLRRVWFVSFASTRFTHALAHALRTPAHVPTHTRASPTLLRSLHVV